MKLKKIILTSLALGSFYASSAVAGLTCEKVNNNFFCEYTNHQVGNSYSWTSTGNISVSSGSGPFANASCTNYIMSTGSLNLTVHRSNGTTTNSSTSLSCSSPFPGGGSYSGPGNVCSNGIDFINGTCDE